MMIVITLLLQQAGSRFDLAASAVSNRVVAPAEAAAVVAPAEATAAGCVLFFLQIIRFM